jgi:hypothetical protein
MEQNTSWDKELYSLMNYIDDDLQFAKDFINIHREKKAVPLDYLKKRYWYNMNTRIKTGSYKKKGVQVVWTFEEYLEWWSDNSKKYDLIVERGLTPSIDRIDSNKHYESSNCRWLPVEVNRALGTVNLLMEQMKTVQSFLRDNEEWLR